MNLPQPAAEHGLFANLAPSKPDPLLSLIAEFKSDPREDKIDLGVGVYQDETGITPVMDAVKQAGITNISIVTQPLEENGAKR